MSYFSNFWQNLVYKDRNYIFRVLNLVDDKLSFSSSNLTPGKRYIIAISFCFRNREVQGKLNQLIFEGWFQGTGGTSFRNFFWISNRSIFTDWYKLYRITDSDQKIQFFFVLNKHTVCCILVFVFINLMQTLRR